jgi:DNA-directed RNA polymerase subunit N (RpoN/RPB10)
VTGFRGYEKLIALASLGLEIYDLRVYEDSTTDKQCLGIVRYCCRHVLELDYGI